MTLSQRVDDLALRSATELKAHKVLINGNAADLSGLNTTNKTNLVSAINEVLAAAGGTLNLNDVADVDTTGVTNGQALVYNNGTWVPGASVPSAATEAAAGIVELATQTETNTGTDDTRVVTPLKLQTRLAAYAQPLDGDLTAIAALTTTAYGRGFLALADQTALMNLVAAASDTVAGKVELATTAETSALAASDRAVTPASLATLMGTKANTSALAAVATSGAYADLIGTVPTSALPPLAINETFVPADQAAMLALTAQRGDMAIRQDNGRTYVLSTDSPGTLADWKEIMAAGAVQSVAGKTGIVSLVKGDVGLGNVDNTSDVNKPVSTAQQTALDGKQGAHANLSALSSLTLANNKMLYSTGPGALALADLTAAGRALLDDADAAAQRTTLDVYSKAEIGNPDTNFVTTFETGLLS